MGVAPAKLMAEPVAKKVVTGIITSSPSLISKHFKTTNKEALPEEVPIQKSLSQ